MQRNTSETSKTIYFRAEHPELAEKAELTEAEISAANAGNLDYNFINPELEMDGAEYNGKRGRFSMSNVEPFDLPPSCRSQEDRMHFQELPDFELLTGEQQNQVIQETINQLQAYMLASDMSDGTCLLANILVPGPEENEIVAISLGDSYSVLVSVDGEKASAVRLNKLHHANEPEENARLQLLPNAQISRGRLVSNSGGKLAVSGALGDIDFEESGLTHTANITRTKVKNNDAESVLITACDGLTLFLADIADLVKDKLHTTNNLANSLSLAAIANGSSDNVSVMTMRVNHRKQPLKKTIGMGVFDGHGSDVSAELTQQKFFAILAENIQKILKNEALSELAKEDLAGQEMHGLTLAFVAAIKTAYTADNKEQCDSRLNESRQLLQQIQTRYKEQKWQPTLFSSLAQTEPDAQSHASRRKLRNMFGQIQEAADYMKITYDSNGLDAVKEMGTHFIEIANEYEERYHSVYGNVPVLKQTDENKLSL